MQRDKSFVELISGGYLDGRDSLAYVSMGE
jgi:hypothetical protein